MSCTPLKFALVNAPAVSFEGQIKKDIRYGQEQRQLLDIYVPDNSDKTHPVVVFFHGGRWTQGSKDQYKFVGIRLAQLGFIAVLPNTRLYPEVRFPIFVEDAALAVSWVHKNIGNYKGDINLFISGHSSGAHVGALMLADSSYLASYQLKPSIISGFVGLSGPYDFVPQSKDVKAIFAPPANYSKMVVTNFIDGNEPPMLLIHSREDKTAHIRNLERLANGIRQKNGSIKTIVYDTGQHSDTVAALSWAYERLLMSSTMNTIPFNATSILGHRPFMAGLIARSSRHSVPKDC